MKTLEIVYPLSPEIVHIKTEGTTATAMYKFANELELTHQVEVISASSSGLKCAMKKDFNRITFGEKVNFIFSQLHFIK